MTDAKILGPVVVDGASGYVGSHLVHKLCRSAQDVRCIVHPGAKRADIDFLKSCGAAVYQTALDEGQEQFRQAMSGAKTAVHLIGSIAPKAGERLEDLHGGQTQQLIKACKSLSVPKIVMVTALGCSADSQSHYHQSKWQAEELLRRSALNYVILRPSLIVGRLCGNRDSKLIARYRKLAQERKAVPLINGGGNLLQPVFIGDLVEALTLSITGNIADGQVLEIGGPDQLSMKRIIASLMESLSLNKPIKAVPAQLVQAAAFVLELIQPVPLVTKDQVIMSMSDNVCSNNALQTVFEIKGTPLTEALSSYNEQCSPTDASQLVSGK